MPIAFAARVIFGGLLLAWSVYEFTSGHPGVGVWPAGLLMLLIIARLLRMALNRQSRSRKRSEAATTYLAYAVFAGTVSIASLALGFAEVFGIGVARDAVRGCFGFVASAAFAVAAVQSARIASQL